MKEPTIGSPTRITGGGAGKKPAGASSPSIMTPVTEPAKYTVTSPARAAGARIRTTARATTRTAAGRGAGMGRSPPTDRGRVRPRLYPAGASESMDDDVWQRWLILARCHRLPVPAVGPSSRPTNLAQPLGQL